MSGIEDAVNECWRVASGSRLAKFHDRESAVAEVRRLRAVGEKPSLYCVGPTEVVVLDDEPRRPSTDPAALRRLADDLMETRRYVRNPSSDVHSMLHAAFERIEWTGAMIGVGKRILANIGDGTLLTRSDPLILEGHLYAAARLLQLHARIIEREAKRDGE